MMYNKSEQEYVDMSGVVDSQMMADQNNHYGDAMQYMEDANINEQ